MTRITPRTCLYPLAASLVVAFALSISLTFRSNHHCYAATCGEWLFPLQARLHVAVWYSWLSLFVTFLAVRAFSPELRRFLRLPVPGLEKYVALSGLLVGIWVVVLYGALIGVWWWRLRDYFVARGHEGGIEKGNGTLAAIALLGHLCDVTLGMVLVPISRHSALASFFSLSVSTTLMFHMATAYTLFGLVMVHGFLGFNYGDYGAHCCDDGAGGEEEALRSVLLYALANYTGGDNHLSPCEHDLLLRCTWTSNVGAGLGDAPIRVAKEIRRQDYDSSRSSFPVTASMAALAPLHSLTSTSTTRNAATPLSEDDFPICFLFRKHGRTNQTPEPSTLGNRFTLLRYLRRTRTASPAEWTDRLASLADKAALTTDSPLHRDAAIPDLEGPFTMLTSPTAWINTAHAAIGVRAEGPYFTPADPARYHTVVCIVAGTGISGALAIISAFAAQKTRDAENAAETDMCVPGTCSAVQEPVPVPVGGRRMWERCVVVWSVREADYIALPALIGKHHSPTPLRPVSRRAAPVCVSLLTSMSRPWNLKPGSANPPHWQRKAEARCREDAGGREGGRE
ncbi:hypothetical protein V501_10563 [Pseudogymnoascus sp. VKM F-4519 (FW-2642)]|nr:hypothetical protein V501_10563 [Pseudogymnoascus sp. VKM F-4519 (FW-2642)]